MRAKWIAIAFISMVVIGGLFWFNLFHAIRNGNGGDITISNNIDNDLVTAGRNVFINAEINGDLTVAGSNVTLAKSIGGYVMAAGSRITINGEIENDLWAAGENVRLNSDVDDNAALAGRYVYLDSNATVGRDARIAGQDVNILGRINRNLKVRGGSLKIASEIGGSLEAHANKVQILPGAVIHGDLMVYGPNAPEISKDAQVIGRVQHQLSKTNKWSLTNWLGWLVFEFLSLVVLGFTIITVASRLLSRATIKITHSTASTFITGFLSLIIIPIACAVLFFTIIGIPLGIVLLALWSVTFITSCVIVSYLLGTWFLKVLKRSDSSAYARMVTGALIVAFLTSLPWLGWIVQIIISVAGMGALILERKDAWRYVPGETAQKPAA